MSIIIWQKCERAEKENDVDEHAAVPMTNRRPAGELRLEKRLAVLSGVPVAALYARAAEL